MTLTRAGCAALALVLTQAPAATSQTSSPSASAVQGTPAPSAAPPQGTATPQGATPPASAAQVPPAVQPGFTYNPEGRRDPFLSLLRRGTTAQRGQITVRPPGLPGLGIAEVTLRGLVQSREGWVAVLLGSDEKTYIVRPGDKLFDGAIRSISQNEMVFLQEVNDPLSLEKQREVKKLLRQAEAN